MYQSAKYRFGGLRESVLERDNWACVKCGFTNEQHITDFKRSLTVDHIDGNGRHSKTPNNNLENLQTLCLKCHGKKDIKRRRPYLEWPEESRQRSLANLKYWRE